MHTVEADDMVELHAAEVPYSPGVEVADNLAEAVVEAAAEPFDQAEAEEPLRLAVEVVPEPLHPEVVVAAVEPLRLAVEPAEVRCLE